MKESIEKTKMYIEEQVYEGRPIFIGESFTKYQKVYLSTNENIKDYIEIIDTNNSFNALSVLGSGDHVFNLICKRIINIDTFDINKLTEFYVFGLRYACILKYNYKEYLKILNIISSETSSLEEITTVVNDLLPYMDNKYRKYWSIINEFNYKIQKENNTNLNLFNLLTLNTRNIKYVIFRNNYLLNEESYNKLRNNILKSNVTFKNKDIMDIPNSFNDNYDLILLSNIFDYMYKKFGLGFKYNDAKNFIDKLKNMLIDNGLLFLNYIFNYSSDKTIRNYIINSSNITLSDLPNSEVIKIDSDMGMNQIKDGVLILKK